MRLLVATVGLLATLVLARQDPGDKKADAPKDDTPKSQATKNDTPDTPKYEPPRSTPDPRTEKEKEAAKPRSAELRTRDPSTEKEKEGARPRSAELRTPDPSQDAARKDASSKPAAKALASVDQSNFRLSDGRVCGMTGTARTPDGQDLDKHKNRFHPPGSNDIDGSVTLSKMLEPGDDLDRFDEEKGARVAGFVIKVKVGGVETCNCKARADVDRDTHIELALSRDADPTEVVIVEVTPRFRAQMKAKGIDWTTEALNSSGPDGLRGKFVEVTGWLLFDSAHISEAENTHPGGSHNWRATCWEIHPITDLKVVQPSAVASLAASHQRIVDLQKARAASLSASQQERLARRNKALLDRFDKDELDEEEAETAPADRPDRKGKADTPKQ
jgi:hypothetical protein